VVDAVATHDPDTDDLVVFAVNRHQSAAVQLSVELRGWPPMRMVSASVLSDRDVRASNTLDVTDRVRPRELDAAHVDGAAMYASLPPVSWNTLRLVPAGPREPRPAVPPGVAESRRRGEQ
jgi:alpha-N-arabinofuranosidase